MEWIDPLTDRTWDEMALAHPEATVFHSSAWARVLARTYGHRPLYFRLSRGAKTEALVPLMEVRSPLTGRRGVCLPFSDCCTPVGVAETGPEALLGCLQELASDRRWKYVEIRGELASRERDGSAPSNDPPYVAHELDLRGGFERVSKGFANSVQRALRKAKRSGLTTRVSSSWDSMQTFVRLHALTRRRHGVPPQPLRFFRNIHRECLDSGLGFVVIAEQEDQPVAAAVFLHFGKNALYKFGASDPGAWESRPNNLVMAVGIKALAERGLETLHFGRSDRPQDGLRRFKRSFGANETRLCYAKFEPKVGHWLPSDGNPKGGHRALFRRLPLIANRLAGRILYPHLD